MQDHSRFLTESDENI